ncbi:MAG: hypothetical protein CVU11_09535 [Bacteroidetes bacterium HGW-Bacteroidetes-6]|jgi:capsular exopolysaccharide synthesis family protein|nr:MAG: hypothetical protein CVU11_09535 [Bacteroidetes bacterium HGW-Bacteroidetes-6]
MAEYKKSKLNDDFDFKLFLFIARRNLKFILVFFALLFALIFMYLRYTLPVYEASSVVQINSDDKAQKLFESKNFYDEDIYRKIEIMRSPVFMERVIEKLPLDVSIFVKGNILNFELYDGAPFHIQYQIVDSLSYGTPYSLTVGDSTFVISTKTAGGTESETEFRFHETVSLPQVNFLLTPVAGDAKSFFAANNGKQFLIVFNSVKDLANSYSQKINIAVLNDVAKTIRISIRDMNPRKAADLVNKVAEEFAAFEVEYQKESSNSILDFIDTQLGLVEDNLDQTEDSMRQGKNMSFDSTLDRSSLQARLFELDNLLAANISELESLDRFYNTFESGNSDFVVLLSLLSGLESQVYLAPYLQSLKELEMKKQDLLVHITENSTAVESVNSQIDFQKRIIRESASGIIAKLRREQQRYIAEKNKISRLLGRPLVNAPDEQNRIERYYTVNEKFYNQLIEKKIEYSIAQAGYVSQLIVLQPAQPDYKPVFPNKKVIWIGVIAFAFILSLAFIILRYVLYNEVVSLRDVKRLTSVPVLGVIPKYKNYIPVSQLIVDSRPKSLLAESLRAIRTNLQFVKNGGLPKVISVTSTVSGEGKTFVAINLAGVLAFNEKSVIVLDFDLRKPKIHLGFNTDNETGISSILLGLQNADECIKQSNIPNLHYITAGPTPLNPSELILSEKMDELISYLKEKYSYIILDTPPIGLVSDAMKPLQFADYPIYIVRASFSKRSYIYNIEKLYHENNLRYLSLILNSVDPEVTGAGSSEGFAYGYGFGYGYGNNKHGYYDEDEIKRSGWFQRLRDKFRKK